MSFLSVYHCQAFLLIFLILVTFLTITSSLANKEMTDEAALRAFRSQVTQDPQGVFNSWNDSRHFCEWEGITCGRRHKRVAVVDLSSKNLHGTLSAYIGNLSFLKELSLYNNSFQGNIPPEFGHLLRLESLYLGHNSLAGKLPANLSQCIKLKYIDLAYNKLAGRIPPQFASLHNLIDLSLLSNNLSGEIPSFLSNFTSLETLSLGKNLIEGIIP